MGFDGMSPCGQNAGERKVFDHGDNMLNLMASGNYNPVPMFAGANKDEGLLQIGSRIDMSQQLYVALNELLPDVYITGINDSLRNDPVWLTHDLVPYLLSVVDHKHGYTYSDLVTRDYFQPEDLGNWEAMSEGIVDVS